MLSVGLVAALGLAAVLAEESGFSPGTVWIWNWETGMSTFAFRDAVWVLQAPAAPSSGC